jgi:hypothetical protein
VNHQKIYDSFHDDMDTATTQEMRSLHDLCQEGKFVRGAGVEFVLAVETVCDERGIDEGS